MDSSNFVTSSKLEINSYLKQIFKKDDNLANKLNVINEENITFHGDMSNRNSFFAETYGSMYYNDVIVRRYNVNDDDFITDLVYKLAKIVHPNIQIFYGLMLPKDERSPLDHVYIVLEYVNFINICDFGFFLNSIFSVKAEETMVKLLMLDQIAQTMAFLYQSECPSLMLNGKIVKLNSNLLKDPYQQRKLIYCSDSYLCSNLIRLTEIGSYLKYEEHYNNIFKIESEDIYEISFHSPDLIKYFLPRTHYDKVHYDKLPCDIWSFGCLIFELFSGKRPFSDIIDKASLIENIDKLFDYSSFCNYHQAYLTEIYNLEEIGVGPQIVELISKCTDGLKSKDIKVKFDDIVKDIQQIIEEFKKKNLSDDKKISKSKSSNQDFQYYHLAKFEYIKSLDSEIKKSAELKEAHDRAKTLLQEIQERYDNLNKKKNAFTMIGNRSGQWTMIDYLLFTMEGCNSLFLYHLHQRKSAGAASPTIEIKIEANDLNTNFQFNTKDCHYFSVRRKKLYVSGGIKPTANNIKTSEMYCFYVEPGEEEKSLKVNKPTKSPGSSKMINMEVISPISKNKAFVFEETKFGKDSTENDTKIEKICHHRLIGNNLVKTCSQAAFEFENYLLLLDTEMSRKCQLFDCKTCQFYFIEEINSPCKNPIFFEKEDVIYMLNFDNIKRHFKEYIELRKKKLVQSKRDSRIVSQTLGMKTTSRISVTKFNTGPIGQKTGISLEESNDQEYEPKYLIFCESYNLKEFSSNPAWKAEIIDFSSNFENDFISSNFEHYKYLTIKDQYIYIVGANTYYSEAEKSSFHLNGIQFSIADMEFSVMSNLSKLTPLQTALKMKSNIIHIQEDSVENVYYLNCEKKEVECWSRV